MPHEVAQEADNSWRHAKDGLVIGSSLIAPDSETHYLPVMNLSDAPRLWYEGARIMEVYPSLPSETGPGNASGRSSVVRLGL